MSGGSPATSVGAELAARLLSPLPSRATVQLYDGTLPSDLAAELPLPIGARLLGSAVRTLTDPPGATRIWSLAAVFDASGEATAVLGAYRRQLRGLGWSAWPVGRLTERSGFSPVAPGAEITLRRPGEGSILEALAVGLNQGVTDLRVTLDWLRPRPFEERRRERFDVSAFIPTLYPPAGAEMQPKGGGGGGEYWWQAAIVRTADPASDLEAHFSRQLEAVDWEQLDGRSEADIAWSSWRFAGGDRAYARLLVEAGFGSIDRFVWLGLWHR